MFNFEDYRPIFDEAEFKDEERIQPMKGYPTPTKLVKSTSTIITSLNQKINIDYLYNFLKSPNCEMSRIDFFNQITVIIDIDIKKTNTTEITKRKINTKIFQSGTIHMTGGQSIKDAQRAIKELLKCIKNIKIKVKLPDEIDKSKYPEYIHVIDNPNISFKDLDYKYRMINRYFKTRFEYNPGILYKLLQEKQLKVTYNPIRFPGITLNTSINGIAVSFLMFKSGKTTISLSNTTDNAIVEAYKYINAIFKEYYPQIVVTEYIL